MYIIFHAIEFDKKLDKFFSPEEKRQIDNFEKKQLIYNPYVGDPLSYKFLREKKVGGKRIYFLIYEELMVVLMVTTSDKKWQQETIALIKSNLREYYLVVQEALKQRV